MYRNLAKSDDDAAEFGPSYELLAVVTSTVRVRELLGSGDYGNHFVAFTDGSCAPHSATSADGPGGWGTIIFGARGERWELRGSIDHTTSNRAEVCGMLAALACVPEEAHLGVQSDSRYLVDHVRAGCRANDNDDLWREVRELLVAKGVRVSASWVPGHNGHRHNERVDALASAGLRRVAPRFALAGQR
ncbi:MAG: hypothetical protein HY675_06720 [Chloroflexi bacterium]|nr:hypothetical protein [Chloroflexota bacterium]